MSDSLNTAPNTPSVVERTRAVPAGAPVVGVHFIGSTAAFVLGEEALLLVEGKSEPRRVAVHEGGILSSACDGTWVVSGGDDGKVFVTGESGETRPVATDAKRRWIDHVAAGPDGAVAWSAGKSAYVMPGKGDPKTVEVPSTVGGLAFAPKGLRLAIAHYNGVSLWFPNAQAAPEFLEWKGSHHHVAFSPDGKFLVTSMQEPALHGWRVVDAKHMRMSGYSARVRSFGWTAGGKWLATSGSEQLVLWPFQGKDGPMGKQPRMYAAFAVRATVVACHPKQEVVAVGFADGTVLLVRIDDGAEVLGKKPGDAPVSALGWDGGGTLLAWGTESGEAGVIDLG
ncbi:MAG: WD40 repeat domain-containing protein [Alphaproteobacteria bacterium]|nr:WD40 repeat domain-containing protein [Alphaproteobacteria bacterium]